MTRSTARGLAGGGALVCLFSLLTPWYVLKLGDFGGDGRSGIDALGTLAVLVAVLAIVAGWSGAARVHALLPPAAAGALVLLVIAKLLSPPSVASALHSSSTGNAAQNQFAEAFASAFTSALGLHYAPAWGIWLAAAGAAAALVGTLASARQS